MANTFILKRSSVASKVPVTGDLADGELAINTTDGRLYYKHSSGVVAEIKSSDATTVGSLSASQLLRKDQSGTLTGNLTVTGTLTGTASISTGGTVSATGNVSGGSLSTTGNISASGSVTAASFYGIGTSLTQLNASNISAGTLSAARIADNSLPVAKVTNLQAALNEKVEGTLSSEAIPYTIAQRNDAGYMSVVNSVGSVINSLNYWVYWGDITLDNSSIIYQEGLELTYRGADSVSGYHMWSLFGDNTPPALSGTAQNVVIFYDPTFSEPATSNVGAWIMHFADGASFANFYAPSSAGLPAPPVGTSWQAYNGSGSIYEAYAVGTRAPAGSLAYDTTLQTLHLATGAGDFTSTWAQVSSGGGGGGSGTPVYIQNTQPTAGPGEKYLWLDTSNGDLQIWVEDGT